MKQLGISGLANLPAKFGNKTVSSDQIDWGGGGWGLGGWRRGMKQTDSIFSMIPIFSQFPHTSPLLNYTSDPTLFLFYFSFISFE
jgi:hypothetical protein